MKFYFVYILESKVNSAKHYTGITGDLNNRLKKHNEGGVPHTTKYKPWFIKNYFAFRSKEKASSFEKYLKSGSGRAFAKRHL